MKILKFVIILILGIFLTACSLGNANLPTLVPQIGQAEEEGILGPVNDESPRTGSGVELPPTWTPGAPVSELPPTPQATPLSVVDIVEAETYIVQDGDTLAEIAERYGVSLVDLAEVNAIANVDLIESGQELIIPSR